MNFKLTSNEAGKVKYMMKQKGGSTVGSDTTLDSAYWLLKQGKPEKSEELEGYPILVKTKDGDEYHFAGEWLMGGEKDILSEEAQNGEEAAQKTPRKRRTEGTDK